jgi:hypothetical protein
VLHHGAPDALPLALGRNGHVFHDAGRRPPLAQFVDDGEGVGAGDFAIDEGRQTRCGA